VTTSCLQTASPSRRHATILALLLLWLALGYTAILVFLAHFPWATALWQAGLCLIANLPLLLAVLRVLTLPKGLPRLPRRAHLAVGALLSLVQFLLPWVGWSALVWLANAGRLFGSESLAIGAAIAFFSYLTGLVLLFLFHPRPRDVILSRHEVPIPDLPPPFDGYQILHLSDTHAGPFLSPAMLARRLAAAASLRPDLVAFTGDLATSGRGRVEAVADLLAGLSTRDGVAAVLGNHDHWIGEERVIAALSHRGIQVLANSHLAISRGEATLFIAGVNDASYLQRDDLAAALKGIPHNAPIILLSHSPDIASKPLAAHASLVLTGHTHGGQVVLPSIGPLYTPSRLGRKRASGLHRIAGRWLFINRGLGEIFPPLRINCPPEIALLTLRRT